MLLQPGGASSLAIWRDGAITKATSVSIAGRDYVPYSPENNLLTHRVIVLPSAVADFGTEEMLVSEIRAFINRYSDLSPDFEEVAAHYVLMTWGYDTFNELPYLRVRGSYGTGKSRFLLTVGSLCYKPIFASGASTVSPIFRLIDQVGGTLVVDEADFWASDERAEIIKILNNGNAKGFPVLRSEVSATKEFSPRAFNIYGPKLVATRHLFEDAALESRCLTEVLGVRPLRRDIPISLPGSFDDEAQILRNKLVAYRFERFSEGHELATVVEPSLEPRRAQIVAPLLHVATTRQARERILTFVSGRADPSSNRDREAELRLLSIARVVLSESLAPVAVGALAKAFDEAWGHEYGQVTNRWVGSVLRRLGLQPQKSNGVYVIPVAELPRLRQLFADYRIEASMHGPDLEDQPGGDASDTRESSVAPSN